MLYENLLLLLLLGVAQQHIRSRLYDGRKLHLRVLLLCVGDLKAYVHENVRVLLASERYALGASAEYPVAITTLGFVMSCVLLLLHLIMVIRIT